MGLFVSEEGSSTSEYAGDETRKKQKSSFKKFLIIEAGQKKNTCDYTTNYSAFEGFFGTLINKIKGIISKHNKERSWKIS